MIVFGTRPEAIKMAPVIQVLKSKSNLFDVKVCVTGQHRQMLDQVLKIFNIKPDYDLDIMMANQDLFDVTTKILLGMRDIFKLDKPDVLLIHGDTTTAFASAVAAFYSGVFIGHIEAGLRTNNLCSPFPEEFNRQLIGKVANIHFCPTNLCLDNLKKEGVNHKNLYITGNTVIDALGLIINDIESNYLKKIEIINTLNNLLGGDWASKKIVLITGHRRENFGDGIVEICNAIKELALAHHDINFVYPIHLNPNIQNPVRAILDGIKNVKLIDNMSYDLFAYLMKSSYFILTDSGGIQEEAPSLGKPVLVMRDTTERPEAVEAGTVLIVGTTKDNIVAQASRLIEDNSLYLKMSQSHNPYGDGNSSIYISKILENINLP